MNHVIAVVIATKNRAEALEKYSLPSLERSAFREFVCVVWDASDDDSSRQAVERGAWNFKIDYLKAPSAGSASQRNDAVQYVLNSYPSARYIVFIDDDSELSPDALDGVREGFLESDVWGVNIPIQAADDEYWLTRLLNVKDRVVLTPFLYNLQVKEDRPGAEIEWTNGGGMAFRAELFRDYQLKFPERFERFGGYALGEDFAFSFFVYKKLHKKLINSPKGNFVHYAYGETRLDSKRMMAARWHNIHLLFEAIYGDAPKLKYLFFKFLFKSAFFAALAKKMFSLRSLSPFKGYLEARRALNRHASRGLFS